MQLRRDERTQRTVSAAMNTLTILVLGAVFYYIWFEGDLIFSHVISLFFSNASIFILAMLVGRRVLPARDFLLYFVSEIAVVVGFSRRGRR